MNTLTPEAIEMLADDYERGMIGPRRLRQYFDYLIQQLAAANAKIAKQTATIEAMKLCWNCKFIEADRCNKHNCLVDYPMREKCDKWQVKEGQ